MPIRSRTTLVIATSLIGAAALTAGAVWAFGGFDNSSSASSASTTAASTTPDTTTPATTIESTTTTIEPTTTTAPTTTIATTTTVKAPTTTAPSGGGGGTCTTASLAGINALRATIPVPALGTMSNATASAWAKKLAAAGSLSHGLTQCGYQVVGYVSRSAPGGESSAPGTIINNWFNSPPHRTVLTHPTPTKIALAFFLKVNADGSWAMYGVGNLC